MAAPVAQPPASGEADRRTVTHRVEISARTILAVGLSVGAIWLFNALLPIVVVVIIALMLVGTLHPAVAWIERHGLKRHLAIAVVFLACGALATATALITVPALFGQVSHTLQQLPHIQQRLADSLEAHHLTAPLANAIRTFKPEDRIRGVNANAAINASLGVVEVVGYAATSVVLAVYFISDAERTRGALYAVVPRRFHVRLARVLLNLETIVGGYLRGQLITSVAIAVFTFGLLAILRVPDALALAAFAGLTDVIPFVGGLLRHDRRRLGGALARKRSGHHRPGGDDPLSGAGEPHHRSARLWSGAAAVVGGGRHRAADRGQAGWDHRRAAGAAHRRRGADVDRGAAGRAAR